MKLIIIMFLSIVVSLESPKEQYLYLDSTLYNYVTPNGKADYRAIIENPYNINQFVSFIGRVSPKNHPEYFQTKEDCLAYWINAYNALIIKLMIDNPNKNILDISWGHLVWFTRFRVGNEKISLYNIEHKILRRLDPRIHFAISCGSKSCPPLGRRIFLGNTLESQLNESTSRFINDSKNVYIDHQNKIVYLNKIFKWYKKDFGNVKKFIINYLEEPVEYSQIKTYSIKYNHYSWASNSLN